MINWKHSTFEPGTSPPLVYPIKCEDCKWWRPDEMPDHPNLGFCRLGNSFYGQRTMWQSKAWCMANRTGNLITYADFACILAEAKENQT